MGLSLTDEQIALIEKLVLNEIKNGNTANPKPCDILQVEYKQLFKIVNEIQKYTEV